MKNSDKPINTVLLQVGTDGSHSGAQTGETTYYSMGLTKLEYFSGIALQGLVAHYGMPKSLAEMENISNCAVNYADYLLAAIEKNT
jgi:hypothetical protein